MESQVCLVYQNIKTSEVVWFVSLGFFWRGGGGGALVMNTICDFIGSIDFKVIALHK